MQPELCGEDARARRDNAAQIEAYKRAVLGVRVVRLANLKDGRAV